MKTTIIIREIETLNSGGMEPKDYGITIKATARFMGNGPYDLEVSFLDTHIADLLAAYQRANGRRMTKLTYSAHWLANDAQCASPDTQESPGAEFLLYVQDAVNEIDEESLIGDVDDDLASETAHEIADGAVPVYTYPMWQTFVDLAAYQEDPTELGADPEDMSKCAGVCLYQIAHRLAVSLIEERKKELGVGTEDE